MSAPMFVLSVGASLGIGAVSAPLLAGVLSKPLTGEVVPTRITDLAGYLTASAAQARGFSGNSGTESFEDPSAADGQGESFGLPSGVSTTPTVPAPKGGPQGPPSPAVATADKKRMLAGVSFAGGFAIAVLSFMLIRRVTQ